MSPWTLPQSEPTQKAALDLVKDVGQNYNGRGEDWGNNNGLSDDRLVNYDDGFWDLSLLDDLNGGWCSGVGLHDDRRAGNVGGSVDVQDDLDQRSTGIDTVVLWLGMAFEIDKE
ncbi:hypothetical protein RR48_09635 [Papilio machaon]|uniref:Uncharacterized protein n=1 Tax=Papilio machaon TaxID=76193 RepID=A0A194R3T3_PAPMA|nr:hypothetical protein RR48_09635 [Papilio machaon]